MYKKQELGLKNLKRNKSMKEKLKNFWEICAMFIAPIISIFNPGLVHNLMQKALKKEAKRLAKEAAEIFSEIKNKTGDSSTQEIILDIFSSKEKLAELPESSREKIKTYCKTVNGFCYMMGLGTGPFKNLINIRSLQFTNYVDQELKKEGFPKQSIKQKEEILEAMELGPAFRQYLELKSKE